MASTGTTGYVGNLQSTHSTGSMLPSSMSVEAVIVSSLLGTIALVAFGVRLFAQQRVGNKFYSEDWVFSAGLLVVLGLCALMIYGACRAGVGWPVELLGPVTVPFSRVLLAVQVLWAVSISLIRAGLLLFYRRIFIRKFQIPNTILLTINVVWVLTSIIVDLATFRWSATKQIKINYPVWLISMSSLDVAQDLAVVCLPLSAIRTLQIKRRRKVLLSAVFMLGLLCIITSGIRLKYFADLGNLPPVSRTVSAVTYHCILWCVIQSCCSLMTACLIGWGPLFAKGRCFHWIVSGARSLFSSRSHSGKSPDATPLREHTPTAQPAKWSVRKQQSAENSDDSDASPSV